MPASITTILYTDPACPWAYSALPALRVLEWRYGDQLDWRLVLIGLTERAEQYVERGYTPLRSARGQLHFRRYGMPFAPQPKTRVAATARACRAVAAARLARPGAEWPALRALQLAQFTTPLVLDDDAAVSAVVAAAAGLPEGEVRPLLDDPAVTAAYERDRAEARTAAGSAAELQEKTARTDGPERYTAPSVAFERDGTRLVAGGFQPVEAYDVAIANLDRSLERRPAAEGAAEVIAAFPDGLTTSEVAAVMAQHLRDPDRDAAEDGLISAVAAGAARRRPFGNDALWTPASVVTSALAA
jgi:2-hydroxychromene-2-carboxylate isomerase